MTIKKDYFCQAGGGHHSMNFPHKIPSFFFKRWLLPREQQREVSKVLLDGLYDSDSPLSNLLGVRTEVVGEIIWQKMLVENWQSFDSCVDI